MNVPKPKDSFIKSFAGTSLVAPTTPKNLTSIKKVSPIVPAGYITPSAPAATATAKPSVAPAQTQPKIISPAGQQYMSSLSGLKEQALGLQSQVQDLKKTENNDSEYLKYVRSIFNPNEAKTQADAYQKSQQRLADIQSERERAEYDARKGYMKTLDTPGGLKSGTQAGAGVYNRRSSDDLADIALQESAAARSAGVAQNSYATYLEQIKEANTPLTFEEAQALGVPIGTTVMEARQQGLIPEKAAPEGFSLSEGQARYDAQGNIIASRGKTYAPGTGSDGASDPNVYSWVNLIRSGQAKITSVPASLKNAVASELAAGGGAASETATQASGIIDQLLLRDTSKVTGAIDQYTGGLFGEAAYTKSLYDQLKGLLSLEKRTLLKGSGAISDYEFKVLEQAASALRRGLTDEDFRTVLAKLKVDLEAGGGSEEGGEVSEEDELRAIGYTEEQIAALKSQ